jgi:hypothetical protein
MLDKGSSNVEEIERDTYRGKDIWSITLSISRDFDPFGLAHLSVEPLQYKRFLLARKRASFLL